MSEQPIWRITVPEELTPASVEALIAEAAPWRTGGTGVQPERIDVGRGKTTVFVSGSEADTKALVARIGDDKREAVGGAEYTACTVEDLHSTGAPSSAS